MQQTKNARGFLGSLNTNIATAILSEVPGAQGYQYQRRLLEFQEKVDSINIVFWNYLKYSTISMLSGPRNPYLVSRVDSINIIFWNYLKYSTISMLSGPRNPGQRDTVHPGHQVPQGALPSLYSCSATSKTPNQRVTTKKSLIFRETIEDDVDTAHPGHQEPSRAYLVSRVDSINIVFWNYLKYSTISMLSGPRNP
ncbi:hypothetical protein TSAR_014486 [Trichomalopsis sarcophagae]|uniref:Uncharacterized protein n=1 Tax=Trichomalopsis sarcophagae TaxID=543379 RepID=A0A232EYR5_9HYME|nr:hypothetical protein TSAR_014486 [Trichomalopsis sarcophagae]